MKNAIVFLFSILILFFSSCTSDIEKGLRDQELQTRLDSLECEMSIQVGYLGQYDYLIKRLHDQNGIIQFGKKRYNVWERQEDLYLLSSLDTNKRTEKFIVEIKQVEAAPGGVTVELINIIRSCKGYYNPIKVENFELSLIKNENSYLTIFIKNNSGKTFVYVEQSQLYSNPPIVEQLRFSSADTLTIESLARNRLIFYEQVKVGNEVKLQEKGYIPYLARLFHL